MNGGDLISDDERSRLTALNLYEREARQKGYVSVAGIDEAGRGPLAGPVVAVACLLAEDLLIAEIDDSKKLTPLKRFEIYQKLIQHALVYYGIGVVESFVIDQINILQATFQAMILALKQLEKKKKVDFLLVDGSQLPPFPVPARGIVRGDSLSQSIAAASVIAKETRDEIMREHHERWPRYGFEQHKGYGTKEHLLAIEKHGPCSIHRMSFEPLKSRWTNKLNLNSG
ncbi:MAG: ribonuclease HII [Anaerolineae bacterium]